MGITEAALKIKLLFDATDVEKGVDKANKAVEGVGKQGPGKFMAAFAAADISKKMVDFGKDSVAAAGASNKAFLKLSSVLRQNGDVTGEAALAADQFAQSLSKKTAVSDEEIQSAQTLLATYKDVGGETARQAGIYDRATAAAVDLAASGFGSIEANAKALGKALTNPEKGMKSLARVGVMFNKQEQEQIKTMVEHGDLLNAQYFMLAKIEGQVGGVAEATATSGMKQEQAYESLQEAIGQKLIPVVKRLRVIIIGVLTFLEDHTGVVIAFASVILLLAQAMIAVTLATKAQTIANVLLGKSIKGLAGPLGWILLGVMALATAIIWLWNNCEWFRDAVTAVWEAIKKAFSAAYNFIAPIMVAIWRAIKVAWDAVWAASAAIINKLMPLIQKLATFFQAKLQYIANIIKSYAKVWFLPIKTAFDVLKALVKGDWDGIIAIFKDIPKRVASALGGLLAAITAPFSKAIQAVKDLISPAVEWIKDKFASISKVIGDAITWAKNAWNTFARGWNAVEVKFEGKKLPGPIPDIPGFTFGLPDLPLFASGGYVKQATLAVVGEGRGAEFISPESMLRKLIREEAGPTIIVNGALDADAVARQIDHILRARARRVGGPVISGASTLAPEAARA